MSSARRSDNRPPSRLRYEESPVLTLRLPLDVYRRFKEHLDRDDAGAAEAIAESLAREKDGLGREIERRRKELDSLGALVNKRREEIASSREAEREKMLKRGGR